MYGRSASAMPGTLVGHPKPVTLQLHPDRPARRAPLHRVVQQVGDRALQHVGVAHHVERVELDVEVQPEAAPPDPVERGVHHVTEVQRLGRRERLVPGQLPPGHRSAR